MRTMLWPSIALLVLAAPACGDDDGGTNGNNLNNNNTPPACGNGQVETGEECDDGAANSDTLPGACRTTCRHAYCGDGVLDAGETCDDGPSAQPDDCPDTCEAPTCGDGHVWRDHEECDDGNTADGDDCRSDCRQDLTLCGNSNIDPGELCDQGALNSNTTPGACRLDCHPARCGDGIVDTGEVCDLGAANSDAPDATCRPDCHPARCGDGIVDTGEVCDDGNDVAGDGCSASCRSNETCGNGITDPGEECDSGAANSDTTPDACRTNCRRPWCGDGVVDPGAMPYPEECDDANGDPRDGCSGCWIAAPRWQCSGTPSTCTCGPGFQGPRCQKCVIHVNADPAITVRDGASWATGLATVNQAVNLLTQYGNHQHAPFPPCEIWIAAGTYPVEFPVSVQNRVKLYGGFAGTETRIEERDLSGNETILTGAAGGGPIAIFNPAETEDDRIIIDGITFTEFGNGALSLNPTGVTVSRCAFRDNASPSSGAAISVSGNVGEPPDVRILSSTFERNAASWGGAVFHEKGLLVIEDCRFTDNQADNGGAMAGGLAGYGRLQIRRSTFLRNQATANGGALFLDDFDWTLESCLLAGNSASQGGGALFGEHSPGAATIWNTTVVQNQPDGIHYSNYGQAFAVRNSILDPGALQCESHPLSSCFDVTYSISPDLAGTGNLAGPPLFVNAAQDDFRLLPGSPGIDAALGDGAPALDLRGVPRTDHAATPNTGAGTPPHVDMGAHELGEACGNGLDDDLDGLADCLAPACAGQPCGAHGQVCQAGACVCPGGATTESQCGDGVDDDCDGLVDCADPDCAGLGACEPWEQTCTDGVDNDANGVADCADPECSYRAVCVCPAPPEIACGEQIVVTVDPNDHQPLSQPFFEDCGPAMEDLVAPGYLPQAFLRFRRPTSGPVEVQIDITLQIDERAGLAVSAADPATFCGMNEQECLASTSAPGQAASFTAAAGQEYYLAAVVASEGQVRDVLVSVTCP
jgi:cysteine-rich repeat protein